MHNFKNIIAWQKSRELVKSVYVLSTEFPKGENYGLTSQIRRAVISIPSNIAEGSGKGSDKDFARFLNIAIGSSFELETQLILCYDLTYISKLDLDKIIDKVNEVQKLIFGFSKTLNKINNDQKLTVS